MMTKRENRPEKNDSKRENRLEGNSNESTREGAGGFGQGEEAAMKSSRKTVHGDPSSARTLSSQEKQS